MIITKDDGVLVYINKKEVLWASDDIKEGLLYICFKGSKEANSYNLVDKNEVDIALTELDKA